MRFRILDCFRGIAAIMVVLAHIPFENSFCDVAIVNTAGSYLVPFFFVLSGFVMHHMYVTSGRFCLTSFVVSRCFRIFPLHIFLLMIICGFDVAHMIANTFFDKNYKMQVGPYELMTNVALIQSLTAPPGKSIIVPAWSMSVEFYTYLVFGLCVTFMRRWLYISFVILVMIALMRKDIIISKEWLACIECFFMGAITYAIHLRLVDKIRTPRILWNVLEIGAIIAVMYAMLIKDRTYLSLIFSVTILIFTLNRAQDTIMFRLMDRKSLHYLGSISYSIYLSHVVVLGLIGGFVGVLEKRVDLNIRSFGPGYEHGHYDFHSYWINAIAIVVICVLVVLFSHVTHRLIELRFMRYGKQLAFRLQSRKATNGGGGGVESSLGKEDKIGTINTPLLHIPRTWRGSPLTRKRLVLSPQ